MVTTAPSPQRFVTLTILLQVAVGGLLMGLIYALVAAGLSLIFGLMDVVNFAHGELLMLGMYATYRSSGWRPASIRCCCSSQSPSRCSR